MELERQIVNESGLSYHKMGKGSSESVASVLRGALAPLNCLEGV